MKTDVLLIHPPAVKPSEPPLGTAILLAALRKRGIPAEAIDANLEGYLHLLDPERVRGARQAPSTPVRRAITHLPSALALLRSPEAVRTPARYQSAIAHLEAALSVYADGGGRLTLGDFVHPEFSEFSPVALEHAAAGKVRTPFFRYFEDCLLPRAEAFAPRIIAVSVNYRHQVLPAFELAGMLRRTLPKTTIVAGGGMFTSWREPLLRLGERFSCFDRIVFGPGEGALAEIAGGEADGYFLEGRGADFLPDFGFAPLGNYLSPVPVLPLGLSRGCYWRKCLFCPEATAPTHDFCAISPREVTPLLAELSRRYGATHFHLTDNAIPVPLLRGLAEMDGPIGWHGFVRFEPALAEPGFVESLERGGCRMLQLGLESGSPSVLDRLGKGTDLRTAARILQNLRKAGIASYVYVLLGTPGETEEDAQASLDFLERHADDISYLNLAVMNLPRDSALLLAPERFGIAEAGGLSESEPLGLYRPFIPANGWGRTEARLFLRRKLLGSSAVRSIVKRTPPAFTSNHAFLFGPSARGERNAAAI